MECDSCRECGEPTGGGWAHMGDPTHCLECHSWTTLLEAGDGVVVDGRHYLVEFKSRVGPGEDSGGLGGRRFVILMDDGRRIVTGSLRCQGVIPARFRDRLPDNARFLDE